MWANWMLVPSVEGVARRSVSPFVHFVTTSVSVYLASITGTRWLRQVVTTAKAAERRKDKKPRTTEWWVESIFITFTNEQGIYIFLFFSFSRTVTTLRRSTCSQCKMRQNVSKRYRSDSQKMLAEWATRVSCFKLNLYLITGIKCLVWAFQRSGTRVAFYKGNVQRSLLFGVYMGQMINNLLT